MNKQKKAGILSIDPVALALNDPFRRETNKLLADSEPLAKVLWMVDRKNPAWDTI